MRAAKVEDLMASGRSLGGLEGRHPAVRPGEYFCFVDGFWQLKSKSDGKLSSICGQLIEEANTLVAKVVIQMAKTHLRAGLPLRVAIVAVILAEVHSSAFGLTRLPLSCF